jgi:hypothetical protein
VVFFCVCFASLAVEASFIECSKSTAWAHTSCPPYKTHSHRVLVCSLDGARSPNVGRQPIPDGRNPGFHRVWPQTPDYTAAGAGDDSGIGGGGFIQATVLLNIFAHFSKLPLAPEAAQSRSISGSGIIRVIFPVKIHSSSNYLLSNISVPCYLFRSAPVTTRICPLY